jgi:oligopeptide transport system ATP-binding protein
VDGVSFAVKRGETLGIVGESGSGKTSVGNCLMSRYRPTDGEIIFDGNNLELITKKGMRKLRRTMQMITQDPFASLDPRFTVNDCVSESIKIHHIISGKKAIDEKVTEMLELVGLRSEFRTRYPHEFSGGQRQRISIARALAVQPSFVVCDEVVSALDVSIQAQIISLLMNLQEKLGLTYVFIGHDLAVVRYISHNVAVMYLGTIMELTGSDELYDHPLHPYTKALISAAPITNPKVDRARERILLKGEIPSPIDPPLGCNFCTRCPQADGRCFEEEPIFRNVGGLHFVACHKV